MKYFRVIKSELRRLFSNKTALICVALVFVAFVVIITAFLMNMELDAPIETEVWEREYASCIEMYEGYRLEYLYQTGALERPSTPNFGVLTGDPSYLLERMNYYKFFIDSHTTRYDYANLTAAHYVGSFFDSYLTEVSRGAYAMFTLMEMAFLPLLVIAFLVVVLNCVVPYCNGIIKNYCASPVGRRTVMGGKLTVALLIDVAAWAAVLVWGLLLGTKGKPVSALCNTGNNYYAVPQYTAYLIRMTGTLVAMLTVTCLAAFMGMWFKNPIKAAASNLLPIGVFVIIYEIILNKGRYITSAQMSVIAQFMPIFGLHFNGLAPYDFRLWIAYAMNFVIAAVLATLAIVLRNRERTFVGLRKKRKKLPSGQPENA